MVEENEINPSIIQFKHFIKEHPHLIKEVRNGDTTWQALYEDWVLLGEEDPRFQVKNEEKLNDASKWISSFIGKIDQKNIENVMVQLSEIISAIQIMLTNMQEKTPQMKEEEKKHPFFSFHKD